MLAPLAWFALTVAVPYTEGQGLFLVRVAWTIAACGWIFQFVLVGAAAPMVRGVANGRPLSQLRALGAGGFGVVRTLIPVVTAVVAIVLGGIALAVPALVLVVLLSMTGASQRAGLTAPLAESAAVARANLRVAAVSVAAIVVVNVMIAAVGYVILFGLTPMAPKPSPAELSSIRALVRVIAIGLVVVSPISASVIAALHTDRSR